MSRGEPCALAGAAVLCLGQQRRAEAEPSACSAVAPSRMAWWLWAAEQRAARGCGGGGGLGLAAGVLCAAALAHVAPCLTQVTATDADSGSFGSLSYSMGSGIGSVVPTQFGIDKHTGQLCTVQPLDRDEGTSAYDFTITAVDGVSAGEAVGHSAAGLALCRGALSWPPLFAPSLTWPFRRVA